MPAYTTIAKIKQEIPASRPDDPTTGLTFTSEAWDAKLTALLAERSAEVDDLVGSRYSFAYEENTQKFPDITSSPATPSVVEKITRWLVVYDALGYYGGTYAFSQDNEQPIRNKWKADAEKMLEKINPSDGSMPKMNISLSGDNLNSSYCYSLNDRPDDQQDEAIFNPDDLDAMWP